MLHEDPTNLATAHSKEDGSSAVSLAAQVLVVFLQPSLKVLLVRGVGLPNQDLVLDKSNISTSTPRELEASSPVTCG